ncbi:hypothetical protein UFOVP53_34 [uncultured Caudovirales phage]|uniref:Uncharacterized protein n=1 Tax=uncultured Caudovirales phage TaxID=2100421 RepID=A0A6J5KQV2_9CAUD|nr:hypothetical protein UFOVP53_34 [uncultured Caudovirales phage]
MTVIEEINELVNRMIESGIEIPGSVLMGIGKYNKMNEETQHHHRYMGSYQPKGATGYCVWTIKGQLYVKLNPEKPYDHLSIGTITLDDFLIEDILFNENPINIDSIN